MQTLKNVFCLDAFKDIPIRFNWEPLAQNSALDAIDQCLAICIPGDF